MANFADINCLTDNYAQTRTFTETDVENILFPPTALTESFSAASTTTDLNRRFKRLSLKKSRYFLHGTTLSEYVRAKKIPRGLRILKRPTLGRHDPEFCEKWCQILNKASLDLTVLVVEHTQKKLAAIKTEMDTLTTELQSAMSPEDLSKLKDDLKITIEKYEQDLSRSKLTKFKRDTLDYKNDNVYPWLKYQDGPARRRTRPRDRDTDVSDSSASDMFTDSDGDFLGPPRAFGEHAQRHHLSAHGGGGAEGTRGGARTRTSRPHNAPTRQSNRNRRQVNFYSTSQM